MTHNSFMEKHLSCSDHAAPASIGSSLRIEDGLEVFPVGKPSGKLVLILDFSDQLSPVVRQTWILVAEDEDFGVY